MPRAISIHPAVDHGFKPAAATFSAGTLHDCLSPPLMDAIATHTAKAKGVGV